MLPLPLMRICVSGSSMKWKKFANARVYEVEEVCNHVLLIDLRCVLEDGITAERKLLHCENACMHFSYIPVPFT